MSDSLIAYAQYRSIGYQELLRSNGIVISMPGDGNCYHNAMVETFFKTLKSELIWRIVYQIRRQAEISIARYIDGFYNLIRRHSGLTYLSPHSSRDGPHDLKLRLNFSDAGPTSVITR